MVELERKKMAMPRYPSENEHPTIDDDNPLHTGDFIPVLMARLTTFHSKDDPTDPNNLYPASSLGDIRAAIILLRRWAYYAMHSRSQPNRKQDIADSIACANQLAQLHPCPDGSPYDPFANTAEPAAMQVSRAELSKPWIRV